MVRKHEILKDNGIEKWTFTPSRHAVHAQLEHQEITKPPGPQGDAAALGAPRPAGSRAAPGTPERPGKAVFLGQSRSDFQSESGPGAPGPAEPQRPPQPYGAPGHPGANGNPGAPGQPEQSGGSDFRLPGLKISIPDISGWYEELLI
ncbi:Protein CBG13241 [Caenorhabditis briggsae]|uniref:Protein CBG13241 n=1 Tax=Caenorhabditis briggsae TaxID=6238 RepID=A8XHD8_CAEBR|nr:Protein CBG13241 [Caenorhabditis briggsae]CAP32062.1 Protein CBG13241 [Caenorhabditis briggsae]